MRAKRDSLALRIISSAVLAPTAIGATYAGGPIFAALVAFLAIVMLFEWTRMVEGHELSRAFYGLAAIGAAAFVLAAGWQFEWAFAASLLAAPIGWLLAKRAQERMWLAFSAAYIVAPSVALIWLRNDVENGRALTIMLFLIVWAADTGGYIGGRLVGGPKLFPALSPAKTWAGAAGGFLMGAAAGFACARWIYGDGPLAPYMAMGAALGLMSILGDATESAFKRSFGVKDASGFIPGHGGALDRLDGMIFATSAMTLALFLHMLYARVLGAGA